MIRRARWAGVLWAAGAVALVSAATPVSAQQRATAIVVEFDGARAGAVEIAARNALSRVGIEVMDSGAVAAARALNGMADGALDEAKAEQLRAVLGAQTVMVYSGAANGERIFASVRLHHAGGVLRRFATSSDQALAADIDRLTGELLTELATAAARAAARPTQPQPAAQPAQPPATQPSQPQPAPAAQPAQPQALPQAQPAPQPQPAQPQPAAQPQPQAPQPAAQPQPQGTQPAAQPQPAQQPAGPDPQPVPSAEGEAGAAVEGDTPAEEASDLPDGAAHQGRTIIGLQYGTGDHGLGPALRFERPLGKFGTSIPMSINLGIDVGLVFDWGGSGGGKYFGIGLPLFIGPTYRLSFGPMTIGARGGMHAQLRYTNVNQGSFWSMDLVLGIDLGLTAEYTFDSGTGLFLGLDGIIREGSEAFVITFGAAL